MQRQMSVTYTLAEACLAPDAALGSLPRIGVSALRYQHHTACEGHTGTFVPVAAGAAES